MTLNHYLYWALVRIPILDNNRMPFSIFNSNNIASRTVAPSATANLTGFPCIRVKLDGLKKF